MNKKAQVTIFIIIGVLLVSSIVGYFLLKDRVFSNKGLPANIEPVYTSFLSCLEEEALVGIDALESQAGYIELPDFEKGSEYMPFSNELNFLGNPIPYWYYISGNNIEKEQIPTKLEMEDSLGKFIDEKILGCKLDNYYDEGFLIDFGDSKTKVNIKDDKVDIEIKMNLNIAYGDDKSLIKDHKIVVDSKLGELYDSAVKIYKKEQDTLFLENYAVDTLRLYAPVDGVEITCSPKVWNAQEVFQDLRQAIEANTLALKSKGGDYTLNNKENKYFVIDLGVDNQVRFLNSQNWSNSFEVNPSEGSVLISKPVGNQAGLGVIGFCYVPYHFVYNVRYPVLVQVESGDEIFQFPLAVVLEGNNPRKALPVSSLDVKYPELCSYKNTPIDVNVYDSNLNPVDAEISYECFGTTCDIGKTNNGKLTSEFPQCANGHIQTRAEGYVEANYLFSTIEKGSADILINKLYNKEINLKLSGKTYLNEAIISFVSDKDSKTIIYPFQKEVELIEGEYTVQVFIYKNSSLKLQETTQQQCIETPQSGVGALLGLTKEKCFEINIPAQIISNVLVGGGKVEEYILESELKSSKIMEINAESLPTPKSIEELQNNYALFENRGLDILFK